MNQVIIAPIVTEKAANAQNDRKYTFWVKADANKIEIANGVKTTWGKDVESVRIMIVPEKARLLKFKHKMTKRPKMKKAIVTLKKGQTLDINEFKNTK